MSDIVQEKKKVVIICADDEAIILLGFLKSLKDIITPEIEIRTASNGRDALNMIRDIHNFDNKIVAALFSDWNMPGMKGDELFQIVHKEYPHIILIMISAYSKGIAEHDLPKNIPHMYMTKPIDMSELKRICENLAFCNEF